jgi:hypothetical protein
LKENDMTKKIELGKVYKDKVLGFEGIAMSITHYFTGCSQVEIVWRGKGEKDNDSFGRWIDIDQLEGVKVAPEDKKPGGPRSHPASRHEGPR